jgi:hypothetical protein
MPGGRGLDARAPQGERPRPGDLIGHMSRNEGEETIMSEEQMKGVQAGRSGRFLGSLKEALVAASRDEPSAPPAPRAVQSAVPPAPPPLPAQRAAAEDAPMVGVGSSVDPDATLPVRREAPASPSAAEAAREVKAQASLRAERPVETDGAPTTRVIKAASKPAASDPAKTQLVRGRQPLKRGEFSQDPVVGWLVVVGGPGLGSYRPIFEGNNTIGRAASSRIPLDFGDGAISSEEQAYIRYDATDRSFLFVPNLAKTNVVSVNDKRPTGAVTLESMDVVVMGRTQLVFVPFCGPDFDWSEITETKD